MKKGIIKCLMVMCVALSLFGCEENSNNNNRKEEMKKQEISILGKEDVFQLIGKEWMLITSGDSTSFNTMTASWGGLGWMWNKPVAYIFVRPERYTHEFIEKNDRLTLSFFAEEYRQALQICGTKSGRDCDKVKMANLTPVSLESGAMSFEESRMILDCKKLFKAEMTDSAFVDKEILDRWYKGEHGGGLHTVYVVEIENVYTK